MKQNINEKINKTNDLNVTNYGCGCAIYLEQQISQDWTKFNDFLIVRVPTSESMEGIFICSFHLYGYGFFLENMERSENLQIYKATDDRDYFYTIYNVTDKNNQYTKTNKAVFNKKELLRYLIEYFESAESFFVSGYVTTIEKGVYEFIY
jgi:hypothetical protein